MPILQEQSIFTPKQERRIREIVFAMTRLALEDAHAKRDEPVVYSLTDDFWREPNGSIPPRPLAGSSPQGLTPDIPPG